MPEIGDVRMQACGCDAPAGFDGFLPVLCSIWDGTEYVPMDGRRAPDALVPLMTKYACAKAEDGHPLLPRGWVYLGW